MQQQHCLQFIINRTSFCKNKIFFLNTIFLIPELARTTRRQSIIVALVTFKKGCGHCAIVTHYIVNLSVLILNYCRVCRTNSIGRGKYIGDEWRLCLKLVSNIRIEKLLPLFIKPSRHLIRSKGYNWKIMSWILNIYGLRAELLIHLPFVYDYWKIEGVNE